MSDENIVGVNLPGTKPAAPTVERSWFPDEAGYQGEPIEYGNKKFYPREVGKATLRAWWRDTQRVQREIKVMAQKQADELEVLQKEDENAELPDERNEFYEAESERLMDELDETYNALLQKGIVGWDLPRPFTTELLFSFSKVDKVALCQAIGSRSTSGFEAVKNSPGRSKR